MAGSAPTLAHHGHTPPRVPTSQCAHRPRTGLLSSTRRSYDHPAAMLALSKVSPHDHPRGARRAPGGKLANPWFVRATGGVPQRRFKENDTGPAVVLFKINPPLQVRKISHAHVLDAILSVRGEHL